MQGDNLAILLFAWALAVTFFLEGRKEVGWRQWLFWGLAGCFLLAGLLWPQLAAFWPQGEQFGGRIATDPTAWFVMFMGGMVLVSVSGKLNAKAVSSKHIGNAAPPGLPPKIEICFEKSAPYEVSDVQHHHVLSTVRIGLRNSGGSVLSNCKIYIDAISPEPPLVGGLPILLEGGGFSLRHDDPEKLIDLATHWDHVTKYRFNAPHGFWAESMNYIEDNVSRTFVIRVNASECQRTGSFRISTDATKAIHLEFIGYVS